MYITTFINCIRELFQHQILITSEAAIWRTRRLNMNVRYWLYNIASRQDYLLEDWSEAYENLKIFHGKQEYKRIYDNVKLQSIKCNTCEYDEKDIDMAISITATILYMLRIGTDRMNYETFINKDVLFIADILTGEDLNFKHMNDNDKIRMIIMRILRYLEAKETCSLPEEILRYGEYIRNTNLLRQTDKEYNDYIPYNCSMISSFSFLGSLTVPIAYSWIAGIMTVYVNWDCLNTGLWPYLWNQFAPGLIPVATHAIYLLLYTQMAIVVIRKIDRKINHDVLSIILSSYSNIIHCLFGYGDKRIRFERSYLRTVENRQEVLISIILSLMLIIPVASSTCTIAMLNSWAPGLQWRISSHYDDASSLERFMIFITWCYIIWMCNAVLIVLILILQLMCGGEIINYVYGLYPMDDHNILIYIHTLFGKEGKCYMNALKHCNVNKEDMALVNVSQDGILWHASVSKRYSSSFNAVITTLLNLNNIDYKKDFKNFIGALNNIKSIPQGQKYILKRTQTEDELENWTMRYNHIDNICHTSGYNELIERIATSMATRDVMNDVKHRVTMAMYDKFGDRPRKIKGFVSRKILKNMDKSMSYNQGNNMEIRRVIGLEIVVKAYEIVNKIFRRRFDRMKKKLEQHRQLKEQKKKKQNKLNHNKNTKRAIDRVDAITTCVNNHISTSYYKADLQFNMKFKKTNRKYRVRKIKIQKELQRFIDRIKLKMEHDNYTYGELFTNIMQIDIGIIEVQCKKKVLESDVINKSPTGPRYDFKLSILYLVADEKDQIIKIEF